MGVEKVGIGVMGGYVISAIIGAVVFFALTGVPLTMVVGALAGAIGYRLGK